MTKKQGAATAVAAPHSNHDTQHVPAAIVPHMAAQSNRAASGGAGGMSTTAAPAISTPAVRSWAERYLALGWSVIPLGRDKRPLIRWEAYQHRTPTPEELADWRRRYRGANIGIVTGAVSGLVVLDEDGPDAQESLRGRVLPPTPTARTGKGYHRYFRHPGRPVPNAVRILPGLDVRGDGGYVMAPPSVHPSGRRYEWVDGLSPWDVPPAPLPEWLLALLADRAPRADTKHGHPPEWRRLVAFGVEEGARNNTIARLAGHLLRRRVDPYVVLELCLAWNQARCRPPLDDAEVVKTVDSIAGRELRRRGGDAG